MSDVGVQGFLRVTISILGPDDKTVYHDLAKEVADEAKNNPSGELTTVIGHGHVFPVGQQRVLRVAEHLAHVPGMVFRRIEVREFTPLAHAH